MESIKNTIVRVLGEHAVGLYDGMPVVTYKKSKDSTELDIDALRADYPDLDEKYMKAKLGGRRFTAVD
jgi:hypothetical protein